MSTPKPDYMTQQAWDYLLRFTVTHEGMVLHMYNNRTSEAAKQDVTCGIGILLIDRDAATGSDYKPMFFDPATQLPATEDQLRDDWDAALNLLRRYWPNANLESTAAGDGYADVCKMRMYPQAVMDKAASVLKSKLKWELDHWLPLEAFISMPSQAQIACVSYFYGWSLAKAPLFRQALIDLNFDRAAKASNLSGASPAKNKAHERLFLNAASISDAVGNGWQGDENLYEVIPQNVNPPEFMIYSYQRISR
jgi:hypothetical protein